MRDSKLPVVHIGGVDSSIMKLLIEWSYAKNVKIDSTNLEQVLSVADLSVDFI